MKKGVAQIVVDEREEMGVRSSIIQHAIWQGTNSPVGPLIPFVGLKGAIVLKKG